MAATIIAAVDATASSQDVCGVTVVAKQHSGYASRKSLPSVEYTLIERATVFTSVTLNSIQGEPD